MKKLAVFFALLAAALSAVVITSPAQAAAKQQHATAHMAATSLQGIPVSGTASDGSVLKGTLDIQRFVASNGNLAVSAILNGTLTSASGAVQQITDQVVTLPLDASGTCKILHLNLGPLDLNLLGLKVHLDKVVLDVTAQSGPGQLLGNLLCGVAHLLDKNGSLTGVLAGLNSILNLLNIANGIPITGAAADGSTFAGTFTPSRVRAVSGHLKMAGTLTGTLTNAAGQTQSVSQAVSLPLAGSGTCSILHLNLAPTDLDLLGLKVHLNRVVLDITAQSGPGNLLGNLLCSVTHLLDRGNSLGAIAQKLNKLLGL